MNELKENPATTGTPAFEEASFPVPPPLPAEHAGVFDKLKVGLSSRLAAGSLLVAAAASRLASPTDANADVYISLEPPHVNGTNAPTMVANTVDTGGWFGGVKTRTSVANYDPTKESWQLMDPNVWSFPMDGFSYEMELPPLDEPQRFFSGFYTEPYFDGQWTPITYLGSNIARNGVVTTQDVVMKFDLHGDIFTFPTNLTETIQAVLVRPSGDTVGLRTALSPEGIATVTASAPSFGPGVNRVYVTFANTGFDQVDELPADPPDEGILASLTLPDGSPDVPAQEAYLFGINVDPAVNGAMTNHVGHSFAGYIDFNAAPPIYDTVSAQMVALDVESGVDPVYSRTFKSDITQPEQFTVVLRTMSGTVLAQTNGVSQLDMMSEYAFTAELTLPASVLANEMAVVADVTVDAASGAALNSGGGIHPNDAGGGGKRTVVPYMIDKSRWFGRIATAAYCPYSWGEPAPGWNPWKQFWRGIDDYMDAFMSHAENVHLVGLGFQFQFGFTRNIPDPDIIGSKPAYRYDGSAGQIAHFSMMFTNRAFTGFTAMSHFMGTSFFDDAISIPELSQAAGNRPGYMLPHSPGDRSDTLTNYLSYSRRMDWGVVGCCYGGFREPARYFGTPPDIDQTVTPIQPTCWMGYDGKFGVVVGSPHFECFGQGPGPALFGIPLGPGNLATMQQSLNNANNYHPEAWSAKPALQGHPQKTAQPN